MASSSALIRLRCGALLDDGITWPNPKVRIVRYLPHMTFKVLEITAASSPMRLLRLFG
jgi:hypothetical protein